MSEPVAVKVSIVRWVDDHQPGFVECRLTDCLGRDWLFIDKAPVFSAAPLHRDSVYPQPGLIRCRAQPRGREEDGRPVVEIDTEQPDGVASVDGTTNFLVFADQLTDG